MRSFIPSTLVCGNSALAAREQAAEIGYG